MTQASKYLRLPAVMELVGLSRTTIYLCIKAGTFPTPIQIGARAVAWDEADIVAWQASLARGVRS